MRILDIKTDNDYILLIKTSDGRNGFFDVKPYLQYEAFQDLKKINSFKKVINGGYYVEWECGADLSADTIEAHLQT